MTVRLLHMLCICGLVAVVYWQSGQFEFLEWDDVGYVTRNPRVLEGLNARSFWWALDTLQMANWHPVTWWSYQIDISLFGLNSRAMHLENALFHAINSLLVYALFVRYGFRALPALLSAAVFAVHPLHVESVAWISERKDLLSTFFLLVLLLVWDRYIRRGRPLDYCIALILAALGLMAKSMLVTLPILLLLLDACLYARLRSGPQPWFRDRQLLARCVEKIPFGILAAVCAWLTLIAQTDGKALNSFDEVGLMDRLGNAVVSYATYVAQTIVPSVEQSFVYIYPLPGLLWIVGALATLGLISWWAAKQGGAVLVGWLWFLVTLLPVIGLIKVGVQARADRYMYLPMIGLLLMLAGTISTKQIFIGMGSRNRRTLGVIACGAVLTLTIAAQRYAGYWRDSETLFNHGLSVDPENPVAHTMLAIFYETQGQAKKSLLHVQAVMRLRPRSVISANAAVSGSNAALLLGNQALARQYLEYTLEISPKHPVAHFNMGTLELRAGNLEAAILAFKLAIASSPRYSEAYNNLGAALLRAGRKEEAIAAFSDAVRTDPNNTGARQNLDRTQGSVSR